MLYDHAEHNCRTYRVLLEPHRPSVNLSPRYFVKVLCSLS
jgi:hypothetical protein